MIEILKLAYRSLKANKLRTRITIAIIAIGITALVGIITSISGIEAVLAGSFSQMGANTFNITNRDIGSGLKKKKGEKRKMRTTNDARRISYKQAILFKERYKAPVITSVNVLISQQATIKFGDKKTNPNIWVMCGDENYIRVGDLQLSYGRALTQPEINSGRNVCIIGSKLAEQLFGKRIERGIGQVINVNSKKYMVSGIFKEKGASFIDRTDNMVWTGLNNGRMNFDLTSKSYVLSVKVNDVKSIEYFAGEAEGIMRSIRKIPSIAESDFYVSNNDEIAESLLENLKYVRLLAIVIGAITLLGAAIGLMNIMLVAVVERTKEIGLSKALGATSQVIKKQFLLESLVISLLGGIWGVVIGVLLGNLVAIGIGASFKVPWFWIILAFTVCAVVGIISGLYPAIKASRLNPINALRYE
jgi:putative ABC transport system permease protein